MKNKKQIVAALMAITLICQSNIVAEAGVDEIRQDINLQEAMVNQTNREIEELQTSIQNDEIKLSDMGNLLDKFSNGNIERLEDEQLDVFNLSATTDDSILGFDLLNNQKDCLVNSIEQNKQKLNEKISVKESLQQKIVFLNEQLEMEQKNLEGVKLEYSAEYNVSDKKITKHGGVFHFGGHKETYYSERVLPGGGLDIPGRHIADDGTIRDEDGYICVASDLTYLARGSEVMTSLGPAKVYDTGCDYGTIDIYVNW